MCESWPKVLVVTLRSSRFRVAVDGSASRAADPPPPISRGANDSDLERDRVGPLGRQVRWHGPCSLRLPSGQMTCRRSLPPALPPHHRPGGRPSPAAVRITTPHRGSRATSRTRNAPAGVHAASAGTPGLRFGAPPSLGPRWRVPGCPAEAYTAGVTPAQSTRWATRTVSPRATCSSWKSRGASHSTGTGQVTPAC
jgi:hypothetical protein